MTSSDLVGSFLVEILHRVEGGDVSKGARNLKIILQCLRLLLSLTCVYILHTYIVYLFYMLDILVLN